MDAGPGAKDALRTRLLHRRRDRPAEQLADARRALAAHVLARAAAHRWRAVAGYEPLRTEPGSTELLSALVDLGVTVIVPVTLAGGELDWTPWPAGPRLGAGALAGVDAVLVPALAVGRDGVRLGRGRGYYDRALSAAPDPVRVALLFDDELLDAVPADPWDERVDAVASPGAWTPVGDARNAGVTHRR